MPKTELTIQLEKALAKQTKQKRIFGCFEVTIGWYGRERVDYLTLDYKNMWRCYEIKVSKSDFYSKSHKTFLGHYNYFVMPEELYEKVKDDIPAHVGVKTIDRYGCIQSLKKAQKQDITDERSILLSKSIIRCLNRDLEKLERIQAESEM